MIATVRVVGSADGNISRWRALILIGIEWAEFEGGRHPDCIQTCVLVEVRASGGHQRRGPVGQVAEEDLVVRVWARVS